MERESAHAYLADAFGFPVYYGKNLDALYDCLTELDDCAVVLEGAQAVRRTDCYGVRILQTLADAAEVNLHLHLEERNDHGTA